MKKVFFCLTFSVIFMISIGIAYAGQYPIPPVDPAYFTEPRDNTFFPMTAIGKTYVYEAETEDELVRSELPDRKGRGHALVLADLYEVDDRLPFGLPAGLGDLVHLEPVDPALVREKEDVTVRCCREEPLYEILFLGFHADLALAPAFLRAVGLERIAFDIPRMGDRDHHLFIFDQVFYVYFRGFGNDLRAPGIAVLGLDDKELIPDDLHDERI